ncbi:uncharacterized protein LOC111518433 [Drosophila willistoni]|uniref:uncharacterized protein LOC111518433 n=1 Tax=Drosophila willistoni TaxID=7260 RepID=UPI000C26D99E|nr:uncharacterized protein LOC111518433 [Drosophila willistoni]
MPVTRSQTAKLASEQRQETPNVDPNVVANVDANVVAVNNDLEKEVEDLRVKMRNMVAVNNDLVKENEDLRVKLSNVVADITQLREKVDSIAADQGAIKEVLTEVAVQRQAPETPFPLKSPAEMRHLESTITPDNQRSHVTEMSVILGQAHLRRSIRKVFSDEMIDAHNMDGTRGKSRLRNYPKIMECLLEAIQLNSNGGRAIDELRGAWNSSQECYYTDAE